MDELISRQAALGEIKKCRFVVDAIEKISALPSAQPEQKTGKWIPCKTPPNDGRSVFIAYGSGGLGTVCIGYYDPDDKCWREHKNWFASLLSGVKYWCEIPELPDGWKEEDDG